MGRKTEILELWYDRVWVQRDLSAIDQMFCPDTRADGIVPGLQIDRDEFKTLVVALNELIVPPRITIQKALEKGDWISSFTTVETTDLSGKRPVRAAGMILARFDGDRMVETYNNFDFLSFFEQLGQLPPNTLELCLTGQKIGG